MLYSGIDEVGSLSQWKIPCRSSTRFSLLDEFDCPFAVDDVDLGGLCRVEISDADSHAGDSASGDLIPVSRLSVSAVGALVRMLKTAAPLRQDFTNLVSSSQANKEEAWTMKGMQHNKEDDVMKSAQSTAPGLFVSRMTSDALEELRCYREVKESILHKRGSQQFDMGQARKPVSEVSKGGLPSLGIGQTEKSVSEGIEDRLHSLDIAQGKKLAS
ncbi:autophagy-related protein 13b-like isoform X1 [Iris pallida]|uniref:Autophagy-related protein 13b-like isoform X1 n=1 Tax=Iris pallida TaxID=29817 RepID=A0AAX6H340_IRIPA|nr:autophagy-related protein 13b-like isoform X1 [Iris pallida]KAJ6835222.1 autophagy-related protein 13b-like isoform X1 [Iris pallida]